MLASYMRQKQDGGWPYDVTPDNEYETFSMIEKHVGGRLVTDSVGKMSVTVICFELKKNKLHHLMTKAVICVWTYFHAINYHHTVNKSKVITSTEQRKLSFHPCWLACSSVCLSFCKQHYGKTHEWIFMKISGYVRHGTSNILKYYGVECLTSGESVSLCSNQARYFTFSTN